MNKPPLSPWGYAERATTAALDFSFIQGCTTSWQPQHKETRLRLELGPALPKRTMWCRTSAGEPHAKHRGWVCRLCRRALTLLNPTRFTCNLLLLRRFPGRHSAHLCKRSRVNGFERQLRVVFAPFLLQMHQNSATHCLMNWFAWHPYPSPPVGNLTVLSVIEFSPIKARMPFQPLPFPLSRFRTRASSGEFRGRAVVLEAIHEFLGVNTKSRAETVGRLGSHNLKWAQRTAAKVKKNSAPFEAEPCNAMRKHDGKPSFCTFPKHYTPIIALSDNKIHQNPKDNWGK